MNKILKNIIVFHYGACIDNTVGTDSHTRIDTCMRHHYGAITNRHICTDLSRRMHRCIPRTGDFL